MDDASFDGGQIGGDSGIMGGDPGMIGGDPNAISGDQGMMDGDQGMMGGDQGMMGGDTGIDGGQDETGGEGTGDDTMSIINQLSDEDREAVRSYAESMLSRDETKINGEDGDAMGGQDQPMMEQVIFTKKQLNKIHENFGPSQDELDKSPNERKKLLNKKRTKTTSNNSPFNPKQFN